jgi:SulP family sulfate permease
MNKTNELTPVLFRQLKNYNGNILRQDILSGIIVGIIAIPLSIALAIKSGVSPEIGLLTAILAGFTASFLSGSTHQISGPTAAFVTIILGIIGTHGIEGLIISTFFAGLIMIALGLLKLGKLIRLISNPIVVGFTTGIAITLFIGQIPDFLGFTATSSEFFDKIKIIFSSISIINLGALLFGCISLAIILFWPKKYNKFVPGSLIAIIISALLYAIIKPDIETIGTKFGILKLTFNVNLPQFSHIDNYLSLIQPILAIAILASIESLLSATAADSMSNSKHNSNMELISQGSANIISALFGGLPATGAIARTSANIKSGGKTPISGIVHALTILIISLIMMPLLSYIPITTLAAILFMVCRNMVNIKEIKRIFNSRCEDIILFLITMILTVVFDLVVAIGIGVALNFSIILIRGSIRLHNKEKFNYKFDFQKNGNVLKFKGSLTFLNNHSSTEKLDIENFDNIDTLDLNEIEEMDISGVEVIHKIVKKIKNAKILANNNNKAYLIRQGIIISNTEI